VAADRPFALDHGGRLSDVDIAYETWGELDAAASNALLVCHAWTGDSHLAGPAGRGHPTPGWWEGVVGPGLAIDTDRYFVVCANVLGGCQGSTGPASIEPGTRRPYGSRFPVITIRDMVRMQARLGDHLGIEQWLSVLGGSMGGMQVLEWGITYPERVRSLVAIATCAQATAQQIAWGAIGRRAIRLDPRWRGGDYYGQRVQRPLRT
jgi:homoserine O-acetyltransferase